MQIKQVKKAVIPAAGFGTRLFPATKAVKKELFPIVDNDGRTKPAIQIIIEEAINAGIEEVGIVVQPEDTKIFSDYFKCPPKAELFNKLAPENQQYNQYLMDLGERIQILIQNEQEGYGHAVFCAQEWVNNEPFLLMLGDHIYSSHTKKSCTLQVLEVYKQVQQNVVSITKIPAELLFKVGCVTGNWQQQDSILTITQVAEKPTIEYARQHLQVAGMAEDEFLCLFGIYVLTPKIFDLLGENIKNNFRERGEFQLTTCLDKLRATQEMTGYLVQGNFFDIGMPNVYRQTMINFGNI